MGEEDPRPVLGEDRVGVLGVEWVPAGHLAVEVQLVALIYTFQVAIHRGFNPP